MVEVLTGRPVQQEVEAKGGRQREREGPQELVHTKNVQTRYLPTYLDTHMTPSRFTIFGVQLSLSYVSACI